MRTKRPYPIVEYLYQLSFDGILVMFALNNNKEFRPKSLEARKRVEFKFPVRA